MPEYGLFGPFELCKATPAYPDSPGTSQAPDPISEATPAYPDLTATSQAQSHPEGYLGLSQFIGHFPGPQHSHHASSEPSHEPFEPPSGSGKT